MTIVRVAVTGLALVLTTGTALAGGPPPRPEAPKQGSPTTIYANAASRPVLGSAPGDFHLQDTGRTDKQKHAESQG